MVYLILQQSRLAVLCYEVVCCVAFDHNQRDLYVIAIATFPKEYQRARPSASDNHHYIKMTLTILYSLVFFPLLHDALHKKQTSKQNFSVIIVGVLWSAPTTIKESLGKTKAGGQKRQQSQLISCFMKCVLSIGQLLHFPFQLKTINQANILIFFEKTNQIDCDFWQKILRFSATKAGAQHMPIQLRAKNEIVVEPKSNSKPINRRRKSSMKSIRIFLYPFPY